MGEDAADRLRMVLLRHDTAEGSHFDWMMEDPRKLREPGAKLWTARVGEPTWRWAEVGRWAIEPLPPHRREYLTYEGPISGDRGRVTRVDEGTFASVHWEADRIVVELATRHFRGVVEIVHRTGGWSASVLSG
jgi:hypothetical protein